MPALLIYFPMGVAIGAWASIAATSVVLGGVLTIASTLGLASLLAQFGRDRGKAKETELYRMWGGKPSTVLLRRGSQSLNRHTLARYHGRLRELLPDLRFPTEDEERDSPAAADEVYEACGDYLLSQTRDTTRFRLVFQENINFGFRRNLWAMKPAGILMNVAGMIITGSLLFARTKPGRWPEPSLTLGFLLDGLMLSWWIGTIRPPWVKVAADAFARQLLASCDQIEVKTGPSRIVPPNSERGTSRPA